jgi:hypothetical protein
MKSALRPICHWACLTALPFALAACQGEKKTPQRGTAEGEILPGSASDAMLPYDTVRSQPPLAPMPTASAKAGGKDDGKPEGAETDDAGAAGSDAAADAAPPATPAAEPAAP